MFFVRLIQLTGYDTRLLKGFDELLRTEAYSLGRVLQPRMVAERLCIDEWKAVELLLDSVRVEVTQAKCVKPDTEKAGRMDSNEHSLEIVFELRRPDHEQVRLVMQG